MSDDLLTFEAVAGLDAEAKGLALSAAERRKLVDALTSRARAVNQLSGTALGEDILGLLGSALRRPVADLLKETWRQRRELVTAAKRGPAAKPVVGEITLYDHTVGLTLHPTVAISLNGVDLPAMRFDVVGTVKVEAATLVIRDACITGFKSGRLKASVAIASGPFPLMAPREKSIDLSREFALPAGGIPLG
ncbi:MAG: hypothetical protein MNPFHGCM_00690 [Gemmatimonadaceae bacterium]|nr:hypothetical protein [Gemmatimonadaceae bacterium]